MLTQSRGCRLLEAPLSHRRRPTTSRRGDHRRVSPQWPVPMLARQVEQIPPATACPGGCRYEPKWNGFRNAAELHSTPARVALAWLMAKPGVTAPIASATSLDHLKDLVEATRVKLPPSAIAKLDEASSPAQKAA